MGGVELTGSGTGNGSGTLDLTEVKVPQGEIGSAYGGSNYLFSHWQDGKVFDAADVNEDAFDKMLKLDGKARTLEQVLTLPLLSAEHFLEPPPEDSGQTEFVREALTRPANAGGMTTPIELVIAQMASAVVYRRAFFEKVFKALDGKVTYHKLAYRPARTCWLLRDPANYSFQGFKQRFLRNGDNVEKEIPAAKSMVYIHGQRRDALVGESDLETAYNIFELKQKVKFLWYSFLENQAMQKMIAKHSNNDKGEIQQFAEKGATLKGAGVLGIAPDQEVTAYPGGQADQAFKDAITYLDDEMAGSVLAGFTNLPTSDAKGSYALSKDGSDLFLRSRGAVLTEMGQTLTNFAVADLVRWNFGFSAPSPIFKFKPLAPEDVTDALSLFKDFVARPAPDSRIPQVFIDLLIEKVAAHLGMPTDKIAEAIRGKDEQAPAERLKTGIDAATALVEAAGVNGAPAEEPAAA